VRDETVARSYAETLFALAERHEGIELFGDGIETVAGLLEENPSFRLFLETPRIADAAKKAVIRKAFGTKLPRSLVSFLLITVDKRRQRLLRDIAREYRALLDDHAGRVHVEVGVARPLDDATLEMLTRRLTALLGKQAIPHLRVKPELLGGVVIRTGDTIYDGSVRRSLERMRRQLLRAELPAGLDV
jgi:F-type H+-transporting ATPase subunit delta